MVVRWLPTPLRPTYMEFRAPKKWKTAALFIFFLVIGLRVLPDRDVCFNQVASPPKERFTIKDEGPPEEYERLRRRLHVEIKEMRKYLGHQLGTLKHHTSSNQAELQTILQQTGEMKRSLISDINRISIADGYDKWRREQAKLVSNIIRKRLKLLQNPPDCRKARKIVCGIPRECGFGCVLNHLAYCLVHAYATHRTLVLRSKGWVYHAKGWEVVFKPLSETCTSTFSVLQPWSNDTALEIYLNKHDHYNGPKATFLPLAVPADLSSRISRFNGDPASWWIGQLLKFIIRPNVSTQELVDRVIRTLNFSTPIVGVQIRRSDKVSNKEASFHGLAEYMEHVADFYEILQISHNVSLTVRKVYIASDDPTILQEARSKYPDYTFVSNQRAASRAMSHATRYTFPALIDLLVDLQLLSSCSYIVCTFSSNVCRVAYALMQAKQDRDSSTSVTSLDTEFFFRATMKAYDRVAILPHVASSGAGDQISLAKGDVIEIPQVTNVNVHLRGNHDGFAWGTNKRTNLTGYFPWFKTEYYLRTYPFPDFETYNSVE